mgnify:CR=1 FL=1|tara:strand:+ start:2087 stop:2284 length:198 start_codon:yes stop_codon:yes gene_type:complete
MPNTTTTTAPEFDAVGFIISYEADDIDTEEDLIEGFQGLRDAGLLNALQGHYQRTAADLLEAGLL